MYGTIRTEEVWFSMGKSIWKLRDAFDYGDIEVYCGRVFAKGSYDE